MAKDITSIVNDTYKHFHENNKKADFKFTEPMLAILRGNIYENYIDDYLNMFNEYDNLSKEQINNMKNELIERINNNPNTSEITHYYMNRCQKQLGSFDPMKVNENLKKLGLF